MWLGSNRQKQRKTSQASQKMDKILLSRYFCCLLCLASQPSHRVTLLPKSEGGMLRENGCERAYFYRCNVYKMAMNKYNVLIIIRLRYRMKAKKSLFTSFITRESIASLSKTVAILTLMSFNCIISR